MTLSLELRARQDRHTEHSLQFYHTFSVGILQKKCTAIAIYICITNTNLYTSGTVLTLIFQ